MQDAIEWIIEADTKEARRIILDFESDVTDASQTTLPSQNIPGASQEIDCRFKERAGLCSDKNRETTILDELETYQNVNESDIRTREFLLIKFYSKMNLDQKHCHENKIPDNRQVIEFWRKNSRHFPKLHKIAEMVNLHIFIGKFHALKIIFFINFNFILNRFTTPQFHRAHSKEDSHGLHIFTVTKEKVFLQLLC